MFTRECPEFIKVAFSEVLPVYKNVDWKNVLHPATPDYDILQPLSYNYSSKTCTDLITTAESKKMLKADLSLRNKKTTAFVLLPIDIKMFELCNYKLSPTHTKN
ncbi:hypothetical protein [Chitinophaga niastensis]|nr:hypothetical protein [Chitinophaga niastensis]